jgi:hypothetical protein
MGHHVVAHLGDGGQAPGAWPLGFPLGPAASKGGLGGALGFPRACGHLPPPPI